MTEPILGILGGMGPEATSYFFQLLIRATQVMKDSEHIRTIIYSNSKIPDRTKAILNAGESPVEEMIRTALVLEKAGADMIFMPCFTAHYFVKDVQRKINIPIINLLYLLKEYIESNYRDIKNIGILCTTGTKKSGIFNKVFNDYTLFYPDEKIQENYVMKAIYGHKGIKAGYTEGEPSNLLIGAGQYLIDQGAEIIIMGCTEIPLALKENAFMIPTINPLKVAAHLLVKKIKG